MNQKYFKYENKNHKKIRIKDLLMLFSIFTLCIITIIVTGTAVNKKKNLKANKNTTEQVADAQILAQNPNEYSVASETISNNLSENPKINVDSAVLAEEIKFIKPVDGGILKPFSPDDLIYSETMDDWRIHLGVDISCPLGTQIVSAEKGVIKSIAYDINFGNRVIVETGEYEHIYSSLSSELYVTEGQNVNKGDPIGVSSDTCMSEICDDPHIHFEIKKNGIYVDPTSVISFN